MHDAQYARWLWYILIVILIVLHRTSMALVYGTVLVCLECTLARTFDIAVRQTRVVLTPSRFLVLLVAGEKIC